MNDLDRILLNQALILEMLALVIDQRRPDWAQQAVRMAKKSREDYAIRRADERAKGF